MIPLREALDDYLAVRRAMGYKLVRAGKLLAQFVDFLDDAGVTTVTIDAAVSWATLPEDVGVNWHAHRLSVVRGFATWLSTVDPDTQVPPSDLLPARKRRATPYLFSDDEVVTLMDATAILRGQLRPATYRTLLGLLAATGLRVGEAIRLDRIDLDVDRQLLTVRSSKFGKTRQLPLHPSVVEALVGYLTVRDRLRPRTDADTDAVFVSMAGTRLLYCNVNWTFLKLVDHAGLEPRSSACRPRLHDLRHSFAVNTILDGYATGGDVHARLPLLSTYLGHVAPASTYWYLSAAPELLAAASRRLDQHLAGRP